MTKYKILLGLLSVLLINICYGQAKAHLPPINGETKILTPAPTPAVTPTPTPTPTQTPVVAPAAATPLVTKAKDNMVSVLAINMSHDGKMTTKSALNGNEGIIVLSTRIDNQAPTAKDLHYFTHLNDLALLDKNKDGRIDHLDLAGERLYLLFFFRSGDKYKLYFWKHPGVRVIFLDKRRLQASTHNPSPDFHVVAEKAIMADGSQRQIGIVAIPRKYLQTVK